MLLTPGRANVIIDGGWGSSGKGKLAGYIYNREHVDLAICDYMPNAGHTYVNDAGRALTTRQLPTAALFGVDCCIGPHAAIDLPLLLEELQMANSRIMIHPLAVIVTDDDKQCEQTAAGHIANTAKGGHSATTGKMLRLKDQLLVRDVADQLKHAGVEVCDTHAFAQGVMRREGTIMIETAQGFDLGLNHGHSYPFVTGRDCLVGRALDNAGLPVRKIGSIIGCLRTFPIRVGNTADGNSGPCYRDQRELTWTQVAETAPERSIVPELTTVTKRVRRVFEFSYAQLARFCDFVGPSHCFLNFVNYLPTVPDMTHSPFVRGVGAYLKDKGCQLSLLGTGPQDSEMLDVSSQVW